MSYVCLRTAPHRAPVGSRRSISAATSSTSESTFAVLATRGNLQEVSGHRRGAVRTRFRIGRRLTCRLVRLVDDPGILLFFCQSSSGQVRQIPFVARTIPPQSLQLSAQFDPLAPRHSLWSRPRRFGFLRIPDESQPPDLRWHPRLTKKLKSFDRLIKIGVDLLACSSSRISLGEMETILKTAAAGFSARVGKKHRMLHLGNRSCLGESAQAGHPGAHLHGRGHGRA